jgi:hypothetical protein
MLFWQKICGDFILGKKAINPSSLLFMSSLMHGKGETTE